ncbi:hypothetical protein BB558_002883 [Smittium angustum]|uniref:Uncharacterized protein n=1 Tax=Smittium angustum TaxID=133377 RepID=A0A2U1J7P6_SMIAN|nr:hypothetical protein BB558_002883 [Smittium angustum]
MDIDIENIPLVDRVNETKVLPTKNVNEEDDWDPSYKMKANIVKDHLAKSLLKKCKKLKIEMTLEELASVQKKILEEWTKNYLSIGSGRVVEKINRAEIRMLFAKGSKVNLMSIDVFKALEPLNMALINESVRWQMKDANSGVSDLAGVVEKCLIDIKGCRVNFPVFVSNSVKEAVILG